jgi:hypothetical protein
MQASGYLLLALDGAKTWQGSTPIRRKSRVGGSQGGTSHDEESRHKYHTEDPKLSRGTHSPSHMASKTTPRPYMPTFLEA